MSAHTFLVASIFTVYMTGMGGLFAYICWTGHHQENSSSDEDERGRDEPAELAIAA
jgi:hypothetical protein